MPRLPSSSPATLFAALVALLCVLWAGAACYVVVQEARAGYLGQGLRR